MADTAGPVTRSRARAVDVAHMPQSAAPSTRSKKSNKRSNRKSNAASISPFKPIEQIKQEPDTTQTHEDNDKHEPVAMLDLAKPVPEPDSADSHEPCCDDDTQDMPATVTAAAAEDSAVAASPCHAPSTVAIAGLTPVVLGTSHAGGCPAATPATMGPSPVMPIKLDSLWSPHAPATGEQISLTPDGSTPAAASSHGASTAGLDLAALFISTPAAATASPVNGLVSAVQPEPADAAACAVQSFAFDVRSRDTALPDDASCRSANGKAAAAAVQQPVPETASFGSPAVETATVKAQADEAGPAVGRTVQPLSSLSDATVALSATTKASTPARSPAPLAAAVGNSTPVSPFPEDDDDLPPADEEFPEEAAIKQASTSAADSMDLQMAVAAVSPAWVTADTATAAQLVADKHTTDEDQLMSDEPVQVMQAPTALDAEQDEAEYAGQNAAEETMMQPLQGMQEAAMAEQEVWAAADQIEGDLLASALAETGDDGDELMEGFDNPVSDDEVAHADWTMLSAPEKASSPEFVEIATSTSPAAAAAGVPFFVASSTLPTAPKSALAKGSQVSKGAGGSTVKKSAHVVLPDAHATPQAAANGHQAGAGSCAAQRTLAGTPAAALGGQTGSSPGHTPYPSKAKVKAATMAADRSSSSAFAAVAKPAASIVSHKKEIGYARAHSALKRHAAAAEPAKGFPSPIGFGSGSPRKVGTACSPAAKTPGMAGGSPGRWRASSSPPVSAGSASQLSSSRLLQPTISFSAKTRAGAQPDVDSFVWRAPSPEKAAEAAATGAGRLASKVVVPSPARKASAASEPSMKALKKSIRDKMEQRAAVTLAERGAPARTVKVHSMQEMRSSKPVKMVPAVDAREEEDLDFDEEIEQYDEQGALHDDQAADELAASMSGLRVGELRPHQPAGPLKGVAAPRGKHLVFDDEGRAKETPVSKLRSKPKHIYFNEFGEPVAAQPAQQTRAVWRR